MRLQLTCSLSGKSTRLPYNYNYAINGWINKVLSKANGDLATFLHSEGYRDGQKTFKFFTFSQPDLRPYVRRQDLKVFELQGDSFTLEVAFWVDEVLKTFVKGLFLHQEGFLGDQRNGLEFVVSQIQLLESPKFPETVRYKTLSPVLIKKFLAGQEYEQHLSPEFMQLSEGQQALFKQQLGDNAEKDYANFYRNCIESNIQEKMRIYSSVLAGQADRQEQNIEFQLLESGKSKLIHIKPGQADGTRLKAYYMTFQLTALPEVHELIYEAGLGDNCSMGLGCLEVLKTKKE